MGQEGGNEQCVDVEAATTGEIQMGVHVFSSAESLLGVATGDDRLSEEEEGRSSVSESSFHASLALSKAYW